MTNIEKLVNLQKIAKSRDFRALTGKKAVDDLKRKYIKRDGSKDKELEPYSNHIDAFIKKPGTLFETNAQCNGYQIGLPLDEDSFLFYDTMYSNSVKILTYKEYLEIVYNYGNVDGKLNEIQRTIDSLAGLQQQVDSIKNAKDICEN